MVRGYVVEAGAAPGLQDPKKHPSVYTKEDGPALVVVFARFLHPLSAVNIHLFRIYCRAGRIEVGRLDHIRHHGGQLLEVRIYRDILGVHLQVRGKVR